MNLNGKQIIAIVSAVLSVLMISTAQLTELLGGSTAKTIVTIAGLINMIMSSINAALASQANTVKEVAAMPGIEPLTINKQANATVAALALDPANVKIAAAAGATPTLEATAKGTTS